MKIFKIVPAILIVLTLATGCDFFRSILGKPTSKDLEAMRAEQLKKELIIKARKDSLLKVAEADKAKSIVKVEENALEDGYYVIMGSFKVKSNADRMLNMLKEHGYSPIRIKFKNGFDVISAVRCDTHHQAWVEMDKITQYKYAPEDIWIYSTADKLHDKK
ncbi:MAG: SPOR domain-containing protein [Bacteroidales bacterium]